MSCRKSIVFLVVLGLVGHAFATLNYEYYEAAGQYTSLADVNFPTATPVRVGTSDTLDSGNGNWVEQAGGHRADDFAFRFTGYIVVPISGEITFYLRSDDGSQLFIDGQMVVDDDGLHGTEGFPGDAGTMTLDAGVYTFEALQFERGGGNTLYVNWSAGGQEAKHVPDAALFTEAPEDISIVPPTVIVDLKATNPTPSDGATELVDADVAMLTWTAGYNAIAYNVYVSMDPEIGDDDLIGTVQDTEIAGPAPLTPGATYYWRVDATDAALNVNEGDVWQFVALPVEAHQPSPANGAVWQATDAQLSWTPGLGALVHNVYFSTDMALVEARDPNVQVAQWLSTATFDPGPLDEATQYFWAVDEFLGTSTNPGPVWSFTTLDSNIEVNVKTWDSVAAGADPSFQMLHVADGVYDIGDLSGDITYEFIVRSNPDETQASMALIGRRGFGDDSVTKAGLKYEQWNNTGKYGATLFGVVDLTYDVNTAPGEYTHLAFVSVDDPNAPSTTLYVNGEEAGVVDRAITLNGIVGIGYAISAEDGSSSFDDFDGSIFGVAVYDRALDAGTIAKNAGAFLSPIPITDPDLMVYYTFETGSGPTVYDMSGHGNNGVVMGDPMWVTGVDGGAMEFDGGGDYVDSGYTEDLATYTIACWVKSPAAPDGSGTSGPLHREKNYQFNWNHGNPTYQGAAAMNNGDWPAAKYGPVEADTWYFITATFDGVFFNAYRDGVLITSVELAAGPVAETGSMKIARHATASGAGNFFTGTVDEARVYNRALNEAEITAIMMGLADVTSPDDLVQGVPNDNDWPGGEPPALSIDNVVHVGDHSSKYLHRKGGSMPTGIQVQPAMGPSVVTGLSLTTANDDYDRDPTTYEISGSNESIDGPYELISAGEVVDFNQVDVWPRYSKNVTPILFENTVAYKYYQVVFPTNRGGSLMQIAEIELLGVPARYVEDFDAIAVGTEMATVDGWEGWAGDAGASAPVSDAFGSNAVEIVGTADQVKLFDFAGGKVTLSCLQYIPSGTAGTTYFICMNQYPVSNDWSVQTTFNMDTGEVGFWHGGTAQIVYDEWVALKYVIDLDNNTVDKYYNGAYIVTDTWDNNAHGTFQAIDLYGNGASSVYYDNFKVQ